jgi:uncharacterized protein YndB with AHSA1/START domain
MNKPQFVYVTYIATTPEKAWHALFDAEMTKQYWGYKNVSDWKPGSTWEHRRADGDALRLTGKVVEFTPPKRLVMTWASPSDAKDPSKHSRVTIEIEPMGTQVKVTVMHDQLEPGSPMFDGISAGWPKVMSGLKSLLETGRPLAPWWHD